MLSDICILGGIIFGGIATIIIVSYYDDITLKRILLLLLMIVACGFCFGVHDNTSNYYECCENSTQVSDRLRVTDDTNEFFVIIRTDNFWMDEWKRIYVDISSYKELEDIPFE